MPDAMLPLRLAPMTLCCALMLTACPKRLVDFGERGEPSSADDLLKRVNAVESQVYALKGDAKLFVDAPQGKGAVDLFISVTHPALIHLEQLDFFGRPQGVLVTNGETFDLYLVPEGKLYRGPASAANLTRFLPIVIPPRELAAVLLGRAPRIPADALAMGFDEKLQQLVLRITRGQVKQTLNVQPPSYRVVKSAAENLDAYAVAFDDLAVQGGVSIARKVIIDAPSARTHLALQWKEVSVNESPDLTLYERLEPPEGVTIVEVDASGVPSEPRP